MEFCRTLMAKIIIIVITSGDGRELYIEYALFSSSLVRAKTHLHISSLYTRVAKGLSVTREEGELVLDA